ncbi:MAG: prepilin-type N-terminal cleavage/methylation domain-containing protein [Solirubrobacterales bacterium]
MKQYHAQAGFSLLELMIVVMVILILAAVLIPRGETVHSKAKLVGLNTNASTLHAMIEAERAKYGSSEGAQVEQIVANRVNRMAADRVPAAADRNRSDLENPVTGAKGMVSYDQLTDDNSISAAACYFTGGEDEEALWNGDTARKRLRGIVAVSLFPQEGELVAKLYPFDQDGRIMKDQIRLVR